MRPCSSCGGVVIREEKAHERWGDILSVREQRIRGPDPGPPIPTGAMQYIYTMKGLGKVHPPDAVVLKDIWLSFLPGAKIGVLGLNGSGKSSLLRIMAGEDQGFVGEAFPAEGITVGFLPQEPRLDASKSVKGNVEEGVAETEALLDRYDELHMQLGQ